MARIRPKGDVQGSLLSHIGEGAWKAPETLPSFDGCNRIAFDSEWDGVDVKGKSLPVGYSFCTEDRRRFYLPVRHQGGGNLDIGVVRRWANHELRGKTLVTLSGKGDIEMSRKDGIDVEVLGCKINEVQYKAALLSDTRRGFDMDSMLFDFLGRRKTEIDRSLIWQLPASEVGPYAENDAEDTLDLDEYLRPRIEAEELGRVLELEDSLIYATLEMERNGVPLNTRLLDSWRGRTTRRFENIVRMVSDQTGLTVNPNSGADLARLFGLLNLTYPRTEPTARFPTGQPSFTDEFLADVDNEIVSIIREARGLSGLQSKYLDKYHEALRNGILYYQLHQLKGDEQYGTISGRYSSSKVNIQQVFNPEGQAEKQGNRNYLIRYLFVPACDKLWFRADASQIELRFFVHYSRSKRLIDLYNSKDDIDFHAESAEMANVSRKEAKTVNFLMLYGGGKGKLSFQLGRPRKESDELYERYTAKFPEMKDLSQEVMGVATTRGYVRTIMGRRARFSESDRAIHSALNRVLQGSAADYLKRKALVLYNLRKQLEITLRLTVHDEFGGDIPSKNHAAELKRVLEEPLEDLKMRVPLKWDVDTGTSWGDCSVPSKWKKEGWVPEWQAA